jgi:hypothetical protein
LPAEDLSIQKDSQPGPTKPSNGASTDLRGAAPPAIFEVMILRPFYFVFYISSPEVIFIFTDIVDETTI